MSDMTPIRAARNDAVHFRVRVMAVIGLCIATVASRAWAQDTTADVIRGRVTDDSSHAIVAAIMVTRGPDRLTQQTTSDSAGNFRVRFEQGTGDYLVYVSATGFSSARRRVQRQADEHDFVANFVLPRAQVATLDAVKIEGRKPVRASNPIGPTQLETGSAEKWRDGVNGQVPPTVAGDLNAIAGTMSNVTMTGGGPSILGAGSESNLNTLNGMGLAAGAIPRAARTETRVTGATFDPTRGGFSGANVDVRLGPGDRNFQRRNAFLTFDPRYLQFTDATGRSLGATSGGARGSVGANGELIRGAMTYNVALDLGRSLSEPSTLLNADAEALLNAGVAPDSVARLIAFATPLGIPLAAAGVPTNRRHDAFAWLGRLDDTRDTLATRALTSYAGVTRDGAVGFGPLAAPSAASERRERTLGAQLTIGQYVGPGRRTLNETRLALSGVRTTTSPYQSLPGATILVRSDNPDAGTDVTSLLVGGGSFLPTAESRWTLEGGNQTEWNAHGRTHRFKGLLWGRVDGLRQEGFANGLGTFAFNSIEDLTAGRASSFSRTLAEPPRDGRAWNVATALAHNFAPSKFFSLLYGARLEADGFGGAPARNLPLEQTLGVRTGLAPSRVHLSPRIGFTFTYNRDRDNGSGTMQNQTGRFYRSMAGTIRGGIGEFRDLLRPGILADASASTGLTGGTSYLNCVGAAVPTPDWTLFAADPGTIPTDCVGGSGVLAERAPAVTLIDPSYDVPRSWRASLDWNTSMRGWLLRVGTLASYDLSQPGSLDANFNGVSRFTLSGEENRPVFVSEASIDPASGAVSAVESRKSDQYGRVSVRVSDLKGYGGQLNLALSPDVFKFRGSASFYGSISYTLQATKRQYRGFDGAAFGDPRLLEWASGANDARHVLVFSTAFSTAKTGTMTLFARAQSGLPFTPLVRGDVNGDGRTGDRAFIPNPTSATDATLAAQLRTLLAGGSSTARGCLLANLGRVAPRNGCRGPWTESVNIQWSPPVPDRWARRVTPNVYLQNVMAGVDQLLHGSSLRGWGSPATPDPYLLIPRGYDAASKRFNYDVNPRFADTRPGRTLLRNPFRIVIDFSFNLSTDFDLQQLRRAVEPVKAPKGGWQRRSADSLAAFYLSNTSDLYKMLIEQTDSLFLTKAQVAALHAADSVFSARVRELYVPLGEFLARGQGDAGKAELDSVQATQKKYWKIFWEQPEIAGAIVTPSQRELMPMFKNMLSTPMKVREHSQWSFGHPITFSEKPKVATPSTQ
ncbi:MAG: carboxypeptidase-like regulatory domain-containing protein [Gemmatimonadaceae bacterium]